MLNIVTLNYSLNEESIINTRIDGEETLLDADILICSPSNIATIWNRFVQTYSSGNQVIKMPHSKLLRNIFLSRKNEIETLLENGKIIISFLEPVEAIKGENNIISHGRKDYSLITNYDFLPFIQDFLLRKLKSGIGKSENSILLKKPSNLFSTYYQAFKKEMTYKAYFDIDGTEDDSFFLLNRANKPVGAIFNASNGIIVLLPSINYDRNNKKLIGVILKESKKFLTKHEITPPPTWVEDYELKGESKLYETVAAIQENIDALESEKQVHEEGINEIIKYKELLYEQGAELERIVIEVFKLFGFEAESRRIDDLEHDVIFKSKEGHGIAEIEGKDNDSIHISKLDQLNRAVDESFDLTGDYPQGLLIGNHYRYIKPDKRKEPFTEKVLIVAKKKSFGLLTTHELFKAVQVILEDPENEKLKKTIREKILGTTGDIIKIIE